MSKGYSISILIKNCLNVALCVQYPCNFDVFLRHLVKDKDVFEALDRPFAKTASARAGDVAGAADEWHKLDEVKTFLQILDKLYCSVQAAFITKIEKTLLNILIRCGQHV